MWSTHFLQLTIAKSAQNFGFKSIICVFKKIHHPQKIQFFKYSNKGENFGYYLKKICKFILSNGLKLSKLSNSQLKTYKSCKNCQYLTFFKILKKSHRCQKCKKLSRNVKLVKVQHNIVKFHLKLFILLTKQQYVFYFQSKDQSRSHNRYLNLDCLKITRKYCLEKGAVCKLNMLL